MNSIRLGFNTVAPIPEDRVVLTPQGFVKHFPLKEDRNFAGFFLCDMRGVPIVWYDEDRDERLIPATNTKEWVDFF